VVAADTPATNLLGKPINDLVFQAADGKAIPIKDIAGSKATVIAFLSFDCPVSNSYSTPLTDLAKSYASKGVAFVGVCPTDDDLAVIAKHAKDYRIGFPVYRDEKLAVANTLKAQITPEVVVLDANRVVVYRGRIDNSYFAKLKKNQQITRHDLREALDATLAGKPVQEPVTPAVGCEIARERKTAAVATVTYHKDVLPILQKNCQGCHRPGEVGPFSLMTYRQASVWAEAIKEFTQSKKMPPWKPSAGHEMIGERKLTESEIAVLAKWADEGAPEGDAKDAPPPAKFPDGWYLGQPDLVLSPKDDFIIGPTGRDLFRVFVMPTGLTEDKYVVAIEVKPGNPRVVHHTLNFFDTTGRARKMEEETQAKERQSKPEVDCGPGYSSAMGVGFRPGAADFKPGGSPPFGAMGGWAPGIIGRYLPNNTGYLLPKGSDLVVQVHYHRDGRIERDRIQIGLYFAKKPVEKRFLSMVIPGRFQSGLFQYIPAGDSHFTAKGAIIVEQDCTLYSVLPHMHLLGKSVKVTMTPPNGKPEPIVDIREWDYNWQETYFLKQPIKVKAGTRFDIIAVYDNSSANPNNPFNPPQAIRVGEQTTNEMLFGFLGATADEPGRGPNRIRFRPLLFERDKKSDSP
jgi:peroxiredoxin